jgi:hypothetical protein
MGGETLALADYAALGSTAANPYEQDYAGDYTVYLLSMNGPIEQSFFPVDNVCRVVGNTTFNFSTSGVIGAGNIVRETSGVLGLTLFSGLCGGFTATGGSGGYLFGYRSGACMKIDSVEQLVQLADAKTQRRSSAEHSNYFLFGVTVMQGTSLSNGDFAELFGGGWTGQYFSFLPIQTNINWLRNLYDNVAVTGYTGNTLIEDYYGTMNSFGTTHMKNLYKDVVAYRADGLQLRNALVNQVTGTSTLQALKEVTGISTAAVLKLAPYADESTALYLPPKAKITKVTSVPESVNLPKTKYTPIFDPLPYDEG